jgi:hypothetical protein
MKKFCLLLPLLLLGYTQAADRLNYHCKPRQMHMVVKLDDFKMLLNIHTDAGTYNGWKEVKYHIQAQSSGGDGDDSDTTTTTSDPSNPSGDNSADSQNNANSKLRVRILSADVYSISDGIATRNPQCGPITDYNFDCPDVPPTTDNFNFQILSDPSGLILDNYFTLNGTTLQSPNQTEILISANWTELCSNYSLQEGEMFCIEAMVLGSARLATSNTSLCAQSSGSSSCMSWAPADYNGQGIVVYNVNSSGVVEEGDPSSFRYNANVLFCAANGENIVRWDPTLTVSVASSLTSAGSSLGFSLLLLLSLLV